MRIVETEGEENSSSSSSSPSTSPTAIMSWMTFKERGREAFEAGDYQTAISMYATALQPETHCPPLERQILLSNMVAARLKIGGPGHVEAAVENAKQCVALNDRWAKGHVRLASAYMALGGHSNDVCNSLQRALQLDPRYPNARQMLVVELRRGQVGLNRVSSTNSPATDSSTPQPSAPPENYDDDHNTNNTSTAAAAAAAAATTRGGDRPPPSAPPENYDGRHHQPHGARDRDVPVQEGQQGQAPFYNPYQEEQPQGPLDDTLTLQDRITFHIQRARTWYCSQSEGVRNLLLILVGLICLYVAFGGRFGLESLGNRTRRGNYQSGNAYDQYYEGQRRSTQAETRHYSSSSSYQNHAYHTKHHGDHEQYYSTGKERQTGGSSSWSSFHMPNLFDGSLHSMAILASIAYLCHRNGINPMQILFFLNMANGGGGGRRRGHMFRYGGGLGGLGGFGRPRPRW